MSSLFAQMAEAHASLLTAAAAAAAEEDAGAARLLELSTAARDLDHALATWRGQTPEASRAALCVADALRQLSEATARFVKEAEHNMETYDDVEGIVEPVRCAVEVCDGSMALGTGKAALLAATHAAREAAIAAQARAFDAAMEMELDELDDELQSEVHCVRAARLSGKDLRKGARPESCPLGKDTLLVCDCM